MSRAAAYGQAREEPIAVYPVPPTKLGEPKRDISLQVLELGGHQGINQRLDIHADPWGDGTENAPQRADAQIGVRGNRDVMFAGRKPRDETHVTPGLPNHLIPVPPETPCKVAPGHVPREPHA